MIDEPATPNQIKSLKWTLGIEADETLTERGASDIINIRDYVTSAAERLRRGGVDVAKDDILRTVVWAVNSTDVRALILGRDNVSRSRKWSPGPRPVPLRKSALLSWVESELTRRP